MSTAPNTWCKPRTTEINSWEPLMQPPITWTHTILEQVSQIGCVRGGDSQSYYTSWWPARYLVAEWTTRSAPRARAFWLIGEAKVPSTHTSTPLLWHISETNLISTQRRYGLVGDSVKNNETWHPKIKTLINKPILKKSDNVNADAIYLIMTFCFSTTAFRASISAGSIMVDCTHRRSKWRKEKHLNKQVIQATRYH